MSSALHTSCAQPPASLAELAAGIGAPPLDAVRQGYEVHSVRAARLCMNAAGWAATASAMALPREDVENQALTYVRDRCTGQEAVVNSLRGRRTGNVQTRVPELAASPAQHCRWCAEWHVRESELWRDEWGQAISDDGRIATRPNWARQSAVSGLAFGDERMHDLESLTESEFTGLFTTGERYAVIARGALPQARYFTLFLNGGPKSAGSVEHAHAQIVGRDDRHFAYPEMIAARCPPDYWQRLRGAHAAAGLAIGDGACTGWVNLAPMKERDITVLSPTVTAGARCMYRIWRALARHGTRNFSLAAILSPAYFETNDCPPRFAQWPPVVWRFVDRGDPDVRHADIGTMELFGSPVVASDPYAVARMLRDA